jgi:ParB/RepB/Spo0J family partition protein
MNSVMEVQEKDLLHLKVNPSNPRGEVLIDDQLLELATSIRSQGVLQPILITPDGTVVAGHRRIKAAELAGLTSVPVVVKDLTPLQQLEAMLVENLQRAALNVVQEGKAFLALQGHGLSLGQISKRTGVCTATVKTRLTVASLAPECHSAFANGRLPVICAERLLPLPADSQIDWVNLAIKNEWRGNQLCSAISVSTREPRMVESDPLEVRRDLLAHVLDRLEQIDKSLDRHSDMRPAQAAVRQAMTKIADSMVPVKRSKPSRDYKS